MDQKSPVLFRNAFDMTIWTTCSLKLLAFVLYAPFPLSPLHVCQPEDTKPPSMAEQSMSKARPIPACSNACIQRTRTPSNNASLKWSSMFVQARRLSAEPRAYFNIIVSQLCLTSSNTFNCSKTEQL